MHKVSKSCLINPLPEALLLSDNVFVQSWQSYKTFKIIWLSNHLTLSVPDRLFQNCVVRTKFDINVFIIKAIRGTTVQSKAVPVIRKSCRLHMKFSLMKDLNKRLCWAKHDTIEACQQRKLHIKATPIKGHTCYQKIYQMHWVGRILLNCQTSYSKSGGLITDGLLYSTDLSCPIITSNFPFLWRWCSQRLCFHGR